MIILVANNTGAVARKLSKSGKLGNLFSPKSQRKPISKIWALDNGRFISYKNSTTWDLNSYIKLLEWACIQDTAPQWVLVPDVVANKEETLKEWDKYLPLIMKYNFTPAIAVQDGMLPSDIPNEAKVIFVGGSTKWKWSTLELWCTNFKRVHVGRVNGIKQLTACLLNGVESVDGTGWFRGCKYQLKTITDFCSDHQMNLFDIE